MTNKKQKSGFTLVELAIVITIIGLLIGGVLKGQEMLTNSRITSTAAQVSSYRTALVTFKDIYKAMPGDITNPSSLLQNCTTTPCSNGGDGNGIVDDSLVFIGVGTFTGNNSEQRKFWLHLNAAGLITGIDPTAAVTGMGQWNVNYPGAKMGGGFQVGYYNIAAAPYGPVSKHFLLLMQTPGPYLLSRFLMTAGQAGQFERKVDDGKPYTGDIIGAPAFDTSSCVNATTELYNETLPGNICNLLLRLE